MTRDIPAADPHTRRIPRWLDRLCGRLWVAAHRRDVRRMTAQGRCYWLPEDRRPSRPDRALSIVTMVRDETPYLAEWLEFHALLGCERFYIYDNGSIDDIRGTLAPFIADGLVTLLDWSTFIRRQDPQRAAHAHALVNYGPDTEWMAFLDLDEFLYPVEEDDLVSLLQHYPDTASLSAYWHMFGHAGHATRPDGLVIENYTKRITFPPPPGDKELLRVKSIVRPERVRAVYGAHVFILGAGIAESVNERCQPIVGNFQQRDLRAGLCCGERIRVNHYFSKSLEEFAARAQTGPRKNAYRRVAKLTPALELADRHGVEDRDILRFLPALRARLARRGLGLGMVGERDAAG